MTYFICKSNISLQNSSIWSPVTWTASIRAGVLGMWLICEKLELICFLRFVYAFFDLHLHFKLRVHFYNNCMWFPVSYVFCVFAIVCATTFKISIFKISNIQHLVCIIWSFYIQASTYIYSFKFEYIISKTIANSNFVCHRFILHAPLIDVQFQSFAIMDLAQFKKQVATTLSAARLSSTCQPECSRRMLQQLQLWGKWAGSFAQIAAWTLSICRFHALIIKILLASCACLQVCNWISSDFIVRRLQKPSPSHNARPGCSCYLEESEMNRQATQVQVRRKGCSSTGQTKRANCNKPAPRCQHETPDSGLYKIAATTRSQEQRLSAQALFEILSRAFPTLSKKNATARSFVPSMC